MRKIVVSEFITLDGVEAASNVPANQLNGAAGHFNAGLVVNHA
jgi:hypothetical protein